MEEKKKNPNFFQRKDPHVDEKHEVNLLLRLQEGMDLTKVWEWGLKDVVERAVKKGLVTEKLQVTDQGREAVREMQEHLAALKEGVPLASRRERTHPERDIYRMDREGDPEWQHGSLGAQLPITTNGEFLFVGRPGGGELKEMPSRLGGTALRHRTRTFIARQIGLFFEVQPVLFQTDGELWPEWEAVWLVDERGKTHLPIQARYFDFIQIRYEKAKLMASREPGKALKVCSYRRGIGEEGIVAMVLPMDLPWPKSGGEHGSKKEV